MLLLSAYVLTLSVVLGLLFLYAWHRHLPEKCMTCSRYEECSRDGKCK